MREKRQNVFIYILSVKWLMQALVLFYKKCVSPLLPNVCVYYPTCSTYMLQSIKKHGALKGTAYGTWRLLRCTPWAKGGFDPVPPKKGDYKWLY